MARLAVVVSISENRPPFKSLASCAEDGAAFSDVLRETARFDEVLWLSDPSTTRSIALKKQLSEFVDKHKSQKIQELVFYYSGHGINLSNEFYFVATDFDETKPASTGLSMEELDIMMRSLAPDLFVKIIDACYSGLSYVKSSDDFEAYMKKTSPYYKDVYFLFSSQGDEKSLTAGNLGAFTRVILETIRNQDGPVRYLDLMNAASDHFANEGRQRPQFVTQASGTEIFCQTSTEMTAIVDKYRTY